LGTWFGKDIDKHDEKINENHMLIAEYNFQRIRDDRILDYFSIKFPTGHVSNFLLFVFDIKNFLKTHEFLYQKFEDKHNISLHHI